MGRGYKYKCRCGYKDSFFVGIGMTYPRVQEELNQDVKNGKYGERLQKIAQENPNGTFSAEQRLYTCPKCDNLQSEYALSFYERSENSNENSLFIPSGYFGEENKEWKMTHFHSHKCRKCGALMRWMRRPIDLKCPKCHKVLPEPVPILWD